MRKESLTQDYDRPPLSGRRAIAATSKARSALLLRSASPTNKVLQSR
jgi:hypothetical protein